MLFSVFFLFFFCRYLTGQVDKRTLEKYEREAKEKNRETWYLSWALDTNQEERDKVGGACCMIQSSLIGQMWLGVGG